MDTCSVLNAYSKNKYIPLNVEGNQKKRKLEKEEYVNLEKEAAWKKFKIAVTGNFGSSIVHTCFSPRLYSNGLGFLILGSTRVDFLRLKESKEGKNQKLKTHAIKSKNYTRFKNFVRSISLRQDEKLIAAGDDSGATHIFETTGCTLLRRFLGHVGSVQCCAFSKSHSSYVMTGGDDATLRLWDVTDGSCVIKIDDAHTDIIRCLKEASSSDATTDFFISGSYDCYVKVWKFNLEALSNKNKQETNALDTPSPSYSIMATFQHGYPVEALLLFKNNNFLLTAGGPEIKVWEVCRDGSLVHSIKSHMKTVTTLGISADGSYIVSGSLDHTVKFYCPLTFHLLHSTVYDQPITSVSLHRDNKLTEWLAIGFINGVYTIKRRPASKTECLGPSSTVPSSLTKSVLLFDLKKKPPQETNDKVVETAVGKRSCWLDRLIQGFYQQKSLDEAIRQSSVAAITLIEAFIEQNSLHVSVRGRDEDSILPLLTFVHRELSREIQTMPLLLEFTHVLLTENPWLYTTTDRRVLQALQSISSKLDIDISQHQMLRELLGILDILRAVCNFS